MELLTAAVLVLAALTLFNLLLSLGLVRRIRQYEKASADGRSSTDDRSLMHPVGTRLAPFGATTVDGAPVVLSGRTVFGFFSTECGGCEVRIADFVPYAAKVPGGASQVLAVVLGVNDEKAARFVSALSAVARVIRESDGGPVSQAFGLAAVPVFGVLTDGYTVEASGYSVDQLPTPAMV
jgi:hypothetical protein